MIPLDFGDHMVFKGRQRGKSVITGGGGARTLEESLGFQGGRGDQSQLTDIKGKT